MPNVTISPRKQACQFTKDMSSVDYSNQVPSRRVYKMGGGLTSCMSVHTVRSLPRQSCLPPTVFHDTRCGFMVDTQNDNKVSDHVIYCHGDPVLKDGTALTLI
ncbi:hypothetical protein CEXT_661591 [Caerostris extrusa]|uniref:Uncharacterized protein n=1 Tax=Caerostris extrusa TaxID=172846 RepID=A0AAV4PQ20_CAEEX|nr:hypothetical protein CEXT_661591 [Caerostris extrusa]